MADAPKVCWKCHKMHEPGIKYCPFCGAAFATEDMHYQTDGRTVSAEDDMAYLSSPPPKYRKGHKGTALLLVIGALLIMMVLLFPQYSSPSNDSFDYPDDGQYVRMNYYVEDGLYGAGSSEYYYYTVHITIINGGIQNLSPNHLRFCVAVDGRSYELERSNSVGTPAVIGIGEEFSAIYRISSLPSEFINKKTELRMYDMGFKFFHDQTITVNI